MRRSNPAEVIVKAPSKGLLKTVPPDQGGDGLRYIVEGENVRAEFGQLKSAPGYERIDITDGNLDSPAVMIHQASIVGTDSESARSAIVATEKSVYVLHRSSEPLQCTVDTCQTRFAVIGNTGDNTIHSGVTVPYDDVLELVRGFSPDFLVHAGSVVSSATVYEDGESPYETTVGKTLGSEFVGRYNGQYGTGPVVNRFFPAMGPGDWVSGPAFRYLDFFALPSSERYYTFSRGPVQFFVLNSYGYHSSDGPQSGPGGVAVDGTGAASGVGESDLGYTNGPMAGWFKSAVAASTATWRVVILNHASHSSASTAWPGYSAVDWPWHNHGIDLVINSVADVYERVSILGVPRLTVGLGGSTKGTFHSPAVTGSAVRYNADYGALVVDASTAALVASFYSRTGSLVDTLELAPQRTSTVCVISDEAKGPAKVEVSPSSATIEVGSAFQYFATLSYADGSVEDVTHSAAWASNSTEVGSVTNGLASGNGLGSAVISATVDGLYGSAILSVRAVCTDAAVDAVLVMDRSGSMGASSGVSTRMEIAKQAAKLFARSMTANDRVGLLSFSGDFFNQLTDPRLDAVLGSSVTVFNSAVDRLAPYGGTGTAAAIDAAKAELASSRAVTGHQKVMVLFTDGFANISTAGQAFLPAVSPYTSINSAGMAAASVSATAAKAAGVKLIVIGLGLKYDPVREATVEAWATTGYYYSVDSAQSLLSVFVSVLSDICRTAGSTPTDCQPVFFNSLASATLSFPNGVAMSALLASEWASGSGVTPTSQFVTWIDVLTNTVGAGTAPTFEVYGTLPPGLSFNTTTAVLSGTPTTPGSYPFYIRIVNPCTVEVGDTPPTGETDTTVLCTVEIT